MKKIIDLKEKIKNEEYLQKQFSNDEGLKNILFISPQLTGNHFYKYLIPYFNLFESGAANTALTGLIDYNPTKRFTDHETPLSSQQIVWADVIVFPFTLQSIVELVETIREINPDIIICYNLDYNFYEIQKSHPHYEDYKDKKVIETIEHNILYAADTCLTSNSQFTIYLKEKFAELKTTKYKKIDITTEIVTIPILTDTNLIYEDLEWESKTKSEAFKIGILCSHFNHKDVSSFSDQYMRINKKFEDKVELHFIGINTMNESLFEKALSGITCEKHKPVTLPNYFNKLNELGIDMLFVPSIINIFNQTSENYNKFLESAILKIPMIAPNMYPYNGIIEPDNTGYFYHRKDEILDIIERAMNDRSALHQVAVTACEFVKDNFECDGENIDLLTQVFN